MGRETLLSSSWGDTNMNSSLSHDPTQTLKTGILLMLGFYFNNYKHGSLNIIWAWSSVSTQLSLIIYVTPVATSYNAPGERG